MKFGKPEGVVILTIAILLGLIILLFYHGNSYHNVANIDTTSDSVVFVGAGDIAGCEFNGDELTASLLGEIPGTIFTLGDNVYQNGSLEEFESCYAPSWGKYIYRTMPAPGNHDYNTKGAWGYYSYFSSRPGNLQSGYYSYNLGKWHIIVLNSNCAEIGGCEGGSEQEKWLREDLEMNNSRCTLAYMHHPRFSLVETEQQPDLDNLWHDLYEKKVDVVLAGHSHNYQRFTPLDSDGKRASDSGMRLFIVGTGGGTLRKISSGSELVESFNDSTHGVMKLTLGPSGYFWEFIPVEGQEFTDSGSAQCH